MSRMITIGSEHPLSRLHVYNPPLIYPRHQFSSMEMARWYVVLVQDGHVDLAHRLEVNRLLAISPGNIAGWVARQGVTVSAEWTFRTSHVFGHLMLHQIINGGTFATAFMNTLDSAAIPPEEVNFVQCTAKREMKWACGLRPNEVLAGKAQPGHNCYGKILDGIKEKVIDANYDWYIESPNNYFDWRQTIVPNYTRTILLLSDSQCRHIESIAGGHREVLSGGTYGDIAKLIVKRNFRFRDFHTVIISCGINDAQKHFLKRRDSWLELEAVLRERYDGAGGPRIVISDAIPHHDAPNVARYTDWIHNRILDIVIVCVNWSKRYPNSPFDPSMYDHRGFHLSLKGTKQLVSCWTKILPALRCVAFNFQQTPTRQFRIKSGQFDWVQRLN